MTTRFNPRNGLIVVRARLKGTKCAVNLRLAVDTGAISTLISHAMLAAAGFNLHSSHEQVEMVTGSGIEYASIVEVKSIRALDKIMRHILVVAHTLPASARIDGLIGLDFLRGERLTIDFASGIIDLKSP